MRREDKDAPKQLTMLDLYVADRSLTLRKINNSTTRASTGENNVVESGCKGWSEGRLHLVESRG